MFLPQASEEYGPISHYYLVVIPNSNATKVQYPDQYNTADLVANSKASSGSDKQSSTVPATDGKKVKNIHYLGAMTIGKMPFNLVLFENVVSFWYDYWHDATQPTCV